MIALHVYSVLVGLVILGAMLLILWLMIQIQDKNLRIPKIFKELAFALLVIFTAWLMGVQVVFGIFQ